MHRVRTVQIAGLAKGANYSSDVTELAKAKPKGKWGQYIHCVCLIERCLTLADQAQLLSKCTLTMLFLITHRLTPPSVDLQKTIDK